MDNADSDWPFGDGYFNTIKRVKGKPSLITNFEDGQLPLYTRAIRIWEIRCNKNIKTLWIEKNATDVYGNVLNTCSSLHLNPSQDLSAFWRIFEALRDGKPPIKIPKPIEHSDWKLIRVKPMEKMLADIMKDGIPANYMAEIYGNF
jgi:hypothetical protein